MYPDEKNCKNDEKTVDSKCVNRYNSNINTYSYMFSRKLERRQCYEIYGIRYTEKSYNVLLLLSGCMYEYGLFFICIVYPLKICD